MIDANFGQKNKIHGLRGEVARDLSFKRDPPIHVHVCSRSVS